MTDHHPGKPCSPDCKVCARPLPELDFLDPIDIIQKSEAYVRGRLIHRTAHELPLENGRGTRTTPTSPP